MEATIVVPAYNEGERIGGALKKYLTLPSVRFLVVCNGCTDGTASVVEGIMRETGRVSLVVFKEKLGKGGAIVEGFRRAKTEAIGFVDADESLSEESLHSLIECVESGAAGAIASRRLPGSHVGLKQPIQRQLSSILFNLIVKVMFGLPYVDTNCGGKVFRKSAIGAVLDDLKTTGFEFDVELLWLLRRKGFDIREIPCEWKHQGNSKFSLLYGPGMIMRLLVLRLSQRT